MKVAAIVAEYNPFHRGHRYHIEKTREAGATHIAAVMSGSVVQRGEFALYDKFTRAKAAVAGGADLVLELPAAYACAPASRFAAGALQIIYSLGCVDMLSFGCECGSAELLCQAADALSDERAAQNALQFIKQGESYPAAFHRAVSELYPQVGDILKSPNNLLAAEYIRAGRKLGFCPELIAVRRSGGKHDSSETGSLASAMPLRRELLSGISPERLLPNAQVYKNAPLSGGLGAIQTALLYRLRTEGEGISLPDRADGLQQRLLTAAKTANNLSELLEAARTKRYTAARVRRAALQAAIGVTDKSYRPIPYLRALCANERGLEILATAKTSALLPISSSLAKLAAIGGEAAAFAEFEAKVSNIYGLTFSPVKPSGWDYTAKFTVVQNKNTKTEDTHAGV